MTQSIVSTGKSTSGRQTGNGTQTVPNFIDGKFTEPAGVEFLPVMNPSIGRQIAKAPLSSAQVINDAAITAQAAFASWSATPVKERAQVFYRYKMLLEKNLQNLAELIHEENGKIMSEAVA